MNFLQKILNSFGGKSAVIRRYGVTYTPSIELSRYRFGETLFLNCAQLLTDIYAELYWETSNNAKALAWRAWVNDYGQRNLLRLLRHDGYIVVGYDESEIDGSLWRFYDLPETAYEKENRGGDIVIRCHNELQRFYVLQSPTFAQTGESDYYWCKPFIKLADAALNGATTTSERLGAYVVLSPESGEFGGVLIPEEKEELEKEMEKEYGALSKQKQLMLLPRPMRSQVVSLAGVDLRMQEKIKAAVLGIADRLKIPANQVAFIDSSNSKSLSNGTELREGDMAKYRSFRRLIDATYYKMARDLGLFVNYRLENEPMSVQGQKIEQQ